MRDIEPKSLTRHARQLRLETLVRLRWLAIAGQGAAVAGVVRQVLWFDPGHHRTE